MRAEELDQPTKEQKMSNEIRLTPREVDQVEAALDTPTPIDPADIRPGDVFRLTHEATCKQIDKRTGDIVSTIGDVFAPATVEGVTWHLVSRPDPDAEARVCAWAEYRKDYAPNPHHEAAAHKAFVAGWQAAREQGWDVVRRADDDTGGASRFFKVAADECDCYPGGFSPETYEGPSRWCPMHGEVCEGALRCPGNPHRTGADQ